MFQGLRHLRHNLIHVYFSLAVQLNMVYTNAKRKEKMRYNSDGKPHLTVCSSNGS